MNDGSFSGSFSGPRVTSDSSAPSATTLIADTRKIAIRSINSDQDPGFSVGDSHGIFNSLPLPGSPFKNASGLQERNGPVSPYVARLSLHHVGPRAQRPL